MDGVRGCGGSGTEYRIHDGRPQDIGADNWRYGGSCRQGNRIYYGDTGHGSEINVSY